MQTKILIKIETPEERPHVAGGANAGWSPCPIISIINCNYFTNGNK